MAFKKTGAFVKTVTKYAAVGTVGAVALLYKNKSPGPVPREDLRSTLKLGAAVGGAVGLSAGFRMVNKTLLAAYPELGPA